MKQISEIQMQLLHFADRSSLSSYRGGLSILGCLDLCHFELVLALEDLFGLFCQPAMIQSARSSITLRSVVSKTGFGGWGKTIFAYQFFLGMKHRRPISSCRPSAHWNARRMGWFDADLLWEKAKDPEIFLLHDLHTENPRGAEQSELFLSAAPRVWVWVRQKSEHDMPSLFVVPAAGEMSSWVPRTKPQIFIRFYNVL